MSEVECGQSPQAAGPVEKVETPEEQTVRVEQERKEKLLKLLVAELVSNLMVVFPDDPTDKAPSQERLGICQSVLIKGASLVDGGAEMLKTRAKKFLQERIDKQATISPDVQVKPEQQAQMDASKIKLERALQAIGLL